MISPITVLHHANIITLAGGTGRAEAVAFQNGKILAIGSESELISEFSDRAEFTYLGGRTVLPGLTDAHIHLQHFALSLQKIDCETGTRQECLARVAERARTTQPGEWILGHGWNQNNWADGFGTAAELDQAAPQNPVYLTAKSLHAAWANSRALYQARISAATPDPPDGRLDRDAQGEPTGILFESAMEFVASAIPAPTTWEIERAIAAAIPFLWQMGLTGVHDFDRRDCFQALQSLARKGQLQLRVVKSLPLEDLPHAVGLGLKTGFGDDFLRIGSMKAFSDGALGPHTAAMLQPYEDDPQNRGILILDAEELYERGRQAVENGLSLAVHAIGDRANHEVLDAYAQLRAYEAQVFPPGSPRLRHRIEHVQVIHPDDAHRLAELGIVASMQPIHATSDMRMADRFWGSRSRLAYALRTQLDLGAQLAFGSDAPVESPNPFWGLHAAVTRQHQDGTPGPEGWYPEQRLTLTEALHGFTTGPAYTAGMEERLGCLAPGYLADLIVLDRDPYSCPTEELFKLKPQATLVDGKWVYRKF